MVLSLILRMGDHLKDCYRAVCSSGVCYLENFSKRNLGVFQVRTWRLLGHVNLEQKNTKNFLAYERPSFSCVTRCKI